MKFMVYGIEYHQTKICTFFLKLFIETVIHVILLKVWFLWNIRYVMIFFYFKFWQLTTSKIKTCAINLLNKRCKNFVSIYGQQTDLLVYRLIETQTYDLSTALYISNVAYVTIGSWRLVCVFLSSFNLLQ